MYVNRQTCINLKDNQKMSTFGQRLKLARTKKGFSQDKLGKLVGMKQPSIAELEAEGKGSSKTPALALALGVNPLWLSEEKGDMLVNVDNKLKQNLENYEERIETIGIPVVGSAQLGDDGFFVELEYPPGYGDGYIDYQSNDAEAYSLKCVGESMKPRIKNGEFVIVEPSHACVSGDEVLIKCIKGRVMVKELLYIRDGMVHLASVNEAHPKIIIEQSEISVMHYVAGIVKKGLWRE